MATDRPRTAHLDVPFGRALRDGFGEYRVFLWHEPVPDDLEPSRFFNKSDALRFLAGLAYDYFNLSTLRALAHECPFGQSAFPMETQSLLDLLASALAHGELRIARMPRAAIALPLLSEKEALPEVAPQQLSASFTLLAVENETDLPISDLKLILKLPGGGDQQQATDAAGRIQVHGVNGRSAAVSSKVAGATFEKSWAYVKLDAAFGGTKSKGKRSASSEFAIRVVAYRVRTGDTLESIARDHRISADDLTKFNWGTTDRKQVDAFLSLMVGCTQQGPDGHYRFDDQDSPGTLLVPQPIDLGGLSVDEPHVMRLHKLHQPEFTFSA